MPVIKDSAIILGMSEEDTLRMFDVFIKDVLEEVELKGKSMVKGIGTIKANKFIPGYTLKQIIKGQEKSKRFMYKVIDPFAVAKKQVPFVCIDPLALEEYMNSMSEEGWSYIGELKGMMIFKNE